MRTLLVAVALVVLPFRASASNVPGDDAFVRRDYPHAIAAYDSLLTRGADSVQILWRMARVYVCIGDVAAADEREGNYRKAETCVRSCIRIDPTCAQGHSWLAASLGSVAMYVGGKTKVQLANEIKEHLDRAIALDPKDDVAFSILGSFYLAIGNVSWIERQLAALFLGGLPDGGYAEAEGALKQAIRLAPTVMRHHFELANVYRAMGRDADALKEYRTTVQLPVVLASDAMRVERSNNWIERLK
jgi:tetratricopeptide (TPR) repeat protein